MAKVQWSDDVEGCEAFEQGTKVASMLPTNLTGGYATHLDIYHFNGHTYLVTYEPFNGGPFVKRGVLETPEQVLQGYYVDHMEFGCGYCGVCEVCILVAAQKK